MKTDEELRKTFNIFVDENGIINLTCFSFEKDPKDNTRVIEIVTEDLSKIFNEDPDKEYSMLVDVTPAGTIIGAQGFSAQTRKTALQLATHKQLKRATLITNSILVKTVVNFIISTSGRSKLIKCFSNKEKALGWLKK